MVQENQVRTINPNDFYMMMQMLKSLLNAGKITGEVADLTAFDLAKEFNEELFTLW